MALGIRAIVDFVFKKIFGSPENSIALMGLLNSILRPKQPIVAVEILNPFSYQEFVGAKQIVLDIKARDSRGRLFSIEMQIANVAGLTQRIVYYACSLYVEQLGRGGDYASLCSAISICFIDKKLFAEDPKPHHSFRLVDQASGRELENAIEIHTLELPRYNLSEETIAQADKLEQWIFLLRKAHEYDAARLRQLLPGIEFDQAISVIETIACKTEDRFMYDQREKALRDQQWLISGAREEGRQEGRQEGESCGIVAGKIQLVQELLGMAVTSSEVLLELELPALESTLNELQDRLRRREV